MAPTEEPDYDGPMLEIDGDIIPVTPHPDHEYTLPTKLVAHGFGVTEATIRRHKQNHADELILGKHYKTVQNMNDGPDIPN